LQHVRQLSLVIGAVHITSETAVACATCFSPTIASVVIHGGLLPDDVMSSLREALANTDTTLVFVDAVPAAAVPASTAPTNTASHAVSDSYPKSIGIGSTESEDVMDLAAKRLASQFADNIKSNIPKQAKRMDNLLQAVHLWKKSTEEFFIKELNVQNAAQHLTELNQFLLRCLSFLNALQLALVSYSGVTLSLAQNQIDHLWWKIAKTNEIPISDTDIPRGVTVQAYVLGLYISKLISQVGFDDEVQLLLDLTEWLHSISVSGVSTDFRIPSKLSSLTILDGCVTCHMAVAAISHKEDLMELRICKCEDANDADVELICNTFPQLRVLEVTGSRLVSVGAINKISHTLKQAQSITVELAPPITLKNPTMDQICTEDRYCRRLKAKLGDNFKLIFNTD